MQAYAFWQSGRSKRTVFFYRDASVRFSARKRTLFGQQAYDFRPASVRFSASKRTLFGPQAYAFRPASVRFLACKRTLFGNPDAASVWLGAVIEKLSYPL
jgi:hypothetical protein